MAHCGGGIKGTGGGGGRKRYVSRDKTVRKGGRRGEGGKRGRGGGGSQKLYSGDEYNYNKRGTE